MDTPKVWMLPPADLQTGERGPAEQKDGTHDELVKHMVKGWNQVPVNETGELTEEGKAMLPKSATGVVNKPVTPATGV